LFEREAVGGGAGTKAIIMAGRISGLKARWQKWLWIAISSSGALVALANCGNGQFARRGVGALWGWNEETITDDLDLRLHLDQWDIGFLSSQPWKKKV